MKSYKTLFKFLTSAPKENATLAGVMPSGLLIDLDGTVLPENNRPTSRVIDAIKSASRIIPTAVASGRVQDDVGHFARLFGLTGPQVSENGATLIDPITGSAINRHILERPMAEQVVSDLRQASSRVLVCDSGRFIDNPDDIKDWQITIIMAKFDNESEAREWTNKYHADSVSVYATVDNLGEWYVDVTQAGVDKATGARDFAKVVGVDPSELMVIGDGWNDVPMFKIAGTAIAMEDASTTLLELATARTLSIDHDGAALAIEKYVLNR
ncbi:MAG: HAD family hydrolase [Dehalococcoidia bacterium]|nr:HAD family hydrolase [Dehalococcoidia bacterium]